MIGFVTSYDEITADCYAVYCEINLPVTTNLVMGNATRARLGAEIANIMPAILAMSHGSENSLLGQDGAPAIDAGNISSFSNQKIFAFSCNTSKSLGRLASENGATWAGFIATISPLVPDADLVDIYEGIFSLILRELPQINSEASAMNLIDMLRLQCDIALEEVSRLSDRPDADIMSIHMSVSQMWQKLAIWIPGHAYSVSHPDAPPLILLN